MGQLAPSRIASTGLGEQEHEQPEIVAAAKRIEAAGSRSIPLLAFPRLGQQPIDGAPELLARGAFLLGQLG